MSMLSEPRRRQKWTLNPRGTLWSQDDSKMGSKMMEKMGWEKGKGLGASGQGNVEPISVRQKEDTKGIGFKGHDSTWIAHQDDFAAVLAQLNETHGQKGEGEEEEEEDDQLAKRKKGKGKKSLEEESKGIKKRVHYHKFTRGKDLSRYSAEDLDCILGSRAVQKKRSGEERRKKAEEEEEVEAEEADDGAEGKDEETKSQGLVTVNRGSLHDYFAQKMSALKAKGVGAAGKSSADIVGNEEPEVESKKKKKKKRRKVVEDEDVEKTVTEGDGGTSKSDANTDANAEKELKKERRKKRKIEVEEEPRRKSRKEDVTDEEEKDKSPSTNSKPEGRIGQEVVQDVTEEGTKKSKKRKKEKREEEDQTSEAAEAAQSSKSIPGFKGSNILSLKGYGNAR